jgi:hypothetical protein
MTIVMGVIPNLFLEPMRASVQHVVDQVTQGSAADVQVNSVRRPDPLEPGTAETPR